MNLTEFRMATNTVSFLDSHAGCPRGMLELRSEPSARLLVWHPEAIDWLFRADRNLAHPGSRTLKPLLGHQSLLWLEGSRHRAYRALLAGQLRGKRLDNYRALIAETTESALTEAAADRSIRLAEWCRDLTLRVIGKLLFGRIEDALLREFTGWIDHALGSRTRTLAYRYLGGGLPRPSRELTEALLARARTTHEHNPPGLLSLLLNASGELADIDDAELMDQIVSLLFAGHETTASATAWTLLHLERHAEIRGQVLTELAATDSDGADAESVPLLHAVVQEALRLSPPAPVAGNRVLGEDTTLLGTDLAAGTVLTPSIYLAQHRAQRYPDPQRFCPHRFLDGRLPNSEYLPFGGGTRSCIGNQFALMEIRMIAASVLRRVELRCPNPRWGVPKLRGHAMAPAARLRMSVTELCR